VMKLIVDSISYSWEARQGKVPALTAFSAEFQSGIPGLLCGKSGSGKTSLGLICSRLVKPDSGSIEFQPDLASKSDIAMVFQFPETLFLEDTVRDEFESIHGDSADSTAKEWLEEVGLDYSKIAERLPAKLSSAERRLTAIALQLSRNPSLLFLDEPTVGLDSMHRGRLIECLRKWISSDRLLIIITHDLILMREFGGETFILKEGKVELKIPTEELLLNRALLEQYDLI